MATSQAQPGAATARARARAAAAAAAISMLAAAVRPAAGGQNAWTPIGPFGGTVTALAVDPGQPQTLYAASYGTGVWKSGDGGASWQAMSQGLDQLALQTIAVAPDGGLWAATTTSWERPTAAWRSARTGAPRTIRPR